MRSRLRKEGIAVFALHLTDLLYPRRCPLCDSLTGGKEGPVCSSCIPKIRFLDPGAFRKDGKGEYKKRRSQIEGHFYDDFIAAFAYEKELRDAVLRFKYSGRAEYAGFFGAALWAFAKDRIQSWNADLILPVPADAGRLRQRGYNQAELLAGEISRLSGIPMEPSMIRRVKRTKPQKGLDYMERRINLSAAFECKGRVPKRVIVIDDILTTGSTMDSAAQCLKNAGAEQVFALCLCAD